MRSPSFWKVFYTVTFSFFVFLLSCSCGSPSPTYSSMFGVGTGWRVLNIKFRCFLSIFRNPKKYIYFFDVSFQISCSLRPLKSLWETFVFATLIPVEFFLYSITQPRSSFAISFGRLFLIGSIHLDGINPSFPPLLMCTFVPSFFFPPGRQANPFTGCCSQGCSFIFGDLQLSLAVVFFWFFS